MSAGGGTVSLILSCSRRLIKNDMFYSKTLGVHPNQGQVAKLIILDLYVLMVCIGYKCETKHYWSIKSIFSINIPQL
jgi:hypothetical protein